MAAVAELVGERGFALFGMQGFVFGLGVLDFVVELLDRSVTIHAVVFELEEEELVVELEVDIQAVSRAFFLDDNTARDILVGLLAVADDERQGALRDEGRVDIVPVEVDAREEEAHLQRLRQFLALYAHGHVVEVFDIFFFGKHVADSHFVAFVVRHIEEVE